MSIKNFISGGVTMIKVKVTKNIMQKGAVIAGLNLKQLVIGALGIAAGFGTLALGWGKIHIDVLMTLVFAIIVAVIIFGVVQINGMSFAKFLFLGLKGVDKRPYCTKGVFRNGTVHKKEK
jgi:hypothetical protein